MLVLAVQAPIQPGKQDAATEAARKMVTETRKEAGCLHYGFSWDVTDPCLLRVIEEWESQEALDQHMKSPHMAELSAALGPIVAGPMVIKRYVVESASLL
jgi:quinol monooxygenase YgiN